MKISVLLAALALSASALAQDTTKPSNPSSPATPAMPGTTTPSLTNPSPGTPSKSGATSWPSFESLDANADGRISSSEASASSALSTKFSALDKQGKGYLTREEYQAAMRTGDRSRGERTGSDTN